MSIVTNAKQQRIQDIFELLEKGELFTDKELADRFNVSTKTIQRDIKTLQESYPIATNEYKQYYFLDGFSVANSDLDIDEQLFLDVVLESVKDSNGSFEKLSNSIKKKFIAPEWKNSYYIQSQCIEKTDIKSHKEQQIVDAIEDKKQLNILYANKEVVIEPYKIANFDGIWYVFATDTQTNKMKTFMLVKIKKIKTTNITFNPIKDIDKILDGVHSAWFEDGSSFDVVVKVYPQIAEYFRLRKYISSQSIVKENTDGSLEIKFTISHDEDLDNLVKSWLPHIEVVSPKRFRKRIADELRLYLKNIEKSMER